MSDDKNEAIPEKQSENDLTEAYFARFEPALKAAISPIVDNLVHELRVQQDEIERQNEELRRAQVELEHARAHNVDLFDFAPVGYATLTADGIVLAANLVGAKMLGKNRKSLLNKHFVNFIPDDYKDTWNRQFLFAKQSKEKIGCEIPFNVETGTTLFFRIDCHYQDPGDALPAMHITLTDLTGHKQTETKLDELTRDFGAFLENTSDFVYFKDADNRFRFCSHSLAKLVGQDKWQAMIGKHLFELFPEETAKVYYEAELPVIQHGKPLLDNLEPYYDATGNKGWVSTSKWPQFDDNGKVIGIFGISRDVTAQIALEKSVRWNEGLNRNILQVLPAHIAVIDPQGFIISVNEAWINFAHSNNAPEPCKLLVGANYLETCRRSSALKDADAARALAGIESVMGGTLGQFTMEYPCHSPQQQRWFSMTVVPFAQGESGGAVIAHQDITASKLNENHLIETEQRWRFALNAANLGAWEMNLSNATVWRSLRHGQIFGYQEPLPEWSYEIFLQHVLEEERKKVAQTIQAAITAHQDYSFECPIRRVDGKLAWILVHAKYSNETPELIYGLVEDITDLKNSHKLLLESETRYRHVLEDQTEVICRFKADGTMLFVNDAFCRLFGKSRDELIGHTWFPVAYPEDIPLINEKLGTLSPSNPIITIENRIFVADGTIHWGQFVNRGFFDTYGNLLEMQAVGRDITESKRAEEELRIAAVAFETQEGIIVADADRAVQRVNQAFTHLTGYSIDEAKGLPFIHSSLAEPDFYKAIWASVLRIGHWQGEVWLMHKNGSVFPAWFTIATATVMVK